MMDFVKFLDNISLHKEVKERVLGLIEVNRYDYEKFVPLLNDKLKSCETFEKLSDIYKTDVYNFHILSIYLLSAHKALDKYIELGIDEKIFVDTMKCFTRFIDECYVKNGKYYFDRAFWTYRQTNMSLFRIGVLEYEFADDEKISIHIPSDSKLSNEELNKSIADFKQFLSKFYPEKMNCEIRCNSWLLSPCLIKYLPEESNILLFQSFFEIISNDPIPLDIYEWVFKCGKETPVEDLREETSLQKKLKNALLNGEKIGTGYGILKKK